MTDKLYEPRYICWYENDFVADVVVRRMTPHQRLMYRSLLQGAFYCSTRPYLPADDQELADLADADSLEMWLANKSAVMRKFTLEDGKWSHKRLLADWEKQVAGYTKAASNGRIGGLKRVANSKQPSSHTQGPLEPPTSTTQANETETETETKQKVKPNQTETETENDSAPVSGSVKGTIDSVDDTRTSVDPSRTGLTLIQVWKEVAPVPGSEANLSQILHDHVASLPDAPEAYLASVILWAFKISNYWPTHLKSSSGFANAFLTIREQHDNYMGKAEANQRENGEASGGTCGDSPGPEEDYAEAF